MSQIKENSLVKNAFILSGASIISKVLGAFYQAFLYQTVGAEGVGIYLKGIYFYAMLLAISASGIPIGISKLMAEERARGRIGEANRIFRYSSILLALIGMIFALGLFFFSPIIAREVFRDERTLYVLQAMAPALFIVTVMGGLRGYFQGKQNMMPTALSQIFEQIARVGFSVAIILYILSTLDFVPVLRLVNGVAFGPTVGAVLGFLVLLVFLYRDKELLKQTDPGGNLKNRQVIKRILLFAVPVTLSALLPTFLDLMEGVIIPNDLIGAGYSQQIADKYWGSFGGAVLALVNLIVAVSAAFATSIVPAISAALGRKNHAEVVKKLTLSMKMVSFISVPASFGLLFLGQPILDLIFDAGDAARILQFSFVMVFFIGLYHNTTGILQGLGRTYIPIIGLSIGLLANVAILNLLIKVPWLNILAGPIAYTAAYLIAFLINYIAIRRTVSYATTWHKWLPRVGVSGLAAALAALFVYKPLQPLIALALGYSLSQLVALLTAVAASVVVYLFALALTGGITRDEAAAIPKLSGVFKRIWRMTGKTDGK